VIARTDELTALANHAGQVVEEFKFMGEDFVYVEKFMTHLKTLARDFKPAPPDRGYIRTNPNAKPDDPVAELEVFERKLRDTIADLDRAKLLLDERRAAIVGLVSSE
jgi:hypothetical protein